MNFENVITIDGRNLPNSAVLYETWQKMNSRVLSLTPINDTFDTSINSGITANGVSGGHVAAWPSPKLFDISESGGGSERLTILPGISIKGRPPTRDDVRVAWRDWLSEVNYPHSEIRNRFLRDVVLPRYGVTSLARLPDNRLADALVCLHVIKREKPVYVGDAKALLDEHVPLTDEPVSYNISREEIEAGTDSGVTTITVRGDSGIKSSGSIYATTEPANVVIDQPVDHDMTPDREIRLSVRTQEFHLLLAGLNNLTNIPLNGTGFVATDHGHSPSMTHAEIDALHDRLVQQADEMTLPTHYLTAVSLDDLRREALNFLIDHSHGAAKARGWWTDKAGIDMTKHYVGENRDNLITQKLMLIISEIVEAFEGVRKDAQDDHLPDLKSLDVELADAFIRLLDTAGGLSIDLAEAYLRKHAYNAVRLDHDPAVRAAAGGKKF